ncbi:NADPH-dependent FMN reductase [Natronorubrum sp. JWXQ-INN-674]|uniref:NADPH-dependent FMN reductase n=1 Tax=Natronorubrum halalkaliphilum TaxID=2691917 RepID=A0A6B0VJ42_9EURY|nr:NADPH-dependent FMN reductase [Natronorubrum halalkaliphilum]MXV61570.1 NADPH-dependent FMN reductase [Natronorubrum halalkaliphilum]
MSHTPSIVAVNGSLRETSYTRTALKYALQAADDAGGETTLLDLQEYDLPVYDPDVDEQGDAEAAMEIVRDADAVALGTPVYHGSYSGALKNFHDYCGWDEYDDTTVGLLATAGGGSYGSTLDHLRITVRGVHGWVLPHQVGLRNASDKFEADPDAVDGRRFRDPDLQERVEKLGRNLVEYAFIDPTVTSSRSAAADD